MSKLIITQKDNEILRMHLTQMQDDQDYMKEKVQFSKQQRTLIDKLETLVKELKVQISARDNELIDARERMSKFEREAKRATKLLAEEKQSNSDLLERIENVELMNKKLQKENRNLRQFIDGEVKEIDVQDGDLIRKGQKLLQSNFKLNNSNVMSENFKELEKDVENMNMITYLALASIELKKARAKELQAIVSKPHDEAN